MQGNTVAVENQTINFANISVENRKPDPFTIVNGRFVGLDGFVVPKNFDEFHERFPEYVRKWVSRHADRSTPEEDVEDWTQDLLVQMLCLPAMSKHREAGKQDIVQTFDPNRHYGANSARFFNYINLCLRNKFSTMRSAGMKNPICRAGNVSLGRHSDASDSGQVDDEFCHKHSAYLRSRCQTQETQRDARHALAQFAEFVQEEDSALLPAMGSMAATATPRAAAEMLGVTRADFRRLSKRLSKLGQFFLAGKARLRRSPKPQPRYTPPCEIAACQVAQSSTAWNRVELYAEVWDQPLVKLSRKYGISDVRLGKVCRKLKIPHPGRGYWAKRAVGQTVEQVPLPEFKDAPVVKRLIRESKPKERRGGKIVPQKGLCVKLCVKKT
jgi:hypothetical protein